MKEKILKIIHDIPQSEPIYQLEFEYRKLPNKEQKEEFLFIIKYLALNGSEKEKFASLYAIELLDKAKESEGEIRSNVEEFKFESNEKLISPLLTLCAALSTTWGIGFIQKVIKYFKPETSEYSYYFDIGIRSIVSTTSWKEAINEIKWAMENYDDDYLIDFIAYFKWKQGKYGIEELTKLVRDNISLTNKINSLKFKIEDRFVNNYKNIDSK